MTGMVLRLLGHRWDLLRLRRIAEKRDRQVAGNGVELALHEVEKLVQSFAQDGRDRQRPQNRPQAVEFLGGIIGAAQPVARFDLGEESARFAEAMMHRAWEGLIEQ